jgi:hypothetical protein
VCFRRAAFSFRYSSGGNVKGFEKYLDKIFDATILFALRTNTGNNNSLLSVGRSAAREVADKLPQPTSVGYEDLEFQTRQIECPISQDSSTLNREARGPRCSPFSIEMCRDRFDTHCAIPRDDCDAGANAATQEGD